MVQQVEAGRWEEAKKQTHSLTPAQADGHHVFVTWEQNLGKGYKMQNLDGLKVPQVTLRVYGFYFPKLRYGTFFSAGTSPVY